MHYRNEPLEIKLPAPNGNYEVTVTIKAHGDTVFSILSQSRRFIVMDEPIKRGEEKEFTFVANVCDYHRRDEEPVHVEGVEVYILCEGDITATAAASPADVPTIYIAGDSTVTDQTAEYPYVPSETYCGWGQMLPMLLNTGIAVSNHAQSGSSTKDFLEINWQAFKDKIKKGDYLIVEFGHNDQKIEELDAFGGYADNLRYFVNFAKEKGAHAILNSPINRIIFQPDGKLLNLLGDYRNAVKAVAEETGVPFIDLWSRTTDYFETAGPVKSWQFFRCKGGERDYTHTNDIGGHLIARFAAQEMAKTKLGLADCIRKELLGVEPIVAEAGDIETSRDAFEHIKNIGLVNVPKAADLADLDADI